MLQIVCGQDADFINDEIKKFNLIDSDKRFSKRDNKYKLDFVGFCIENNKMLAVFPKHYFDETNINELTRLEIEKNVELLFKVICKYNRENNSKLKATKYIGYENDFISDYPFDDFYDVYEYYRKYGIYKEDETKLEISTKGKISWKDTIQKSNVLVSNKNLIFLPIYSKVKNSKNVFISECMTFVINHTIRTFNCFLKLPLITKKESKFNFLANREYTLRELYQYKNTIFKDNEKSLINSLINFFEKYDKQCHSGNIHFKINYFDRIWERMVNKYLNDCFIKVDSENNKLLFESKKSKNVKKFRDKTFNDIDISENHYSIRPDHFLQENDNIYIFDSKYYEDMNELNYKQFTYTLLLGNSQLGKDKNIYSALLLPGIQKDKLHIKLNIPYCQMKPGCNFIIEQYLNVKLLMENYLN